MPLREVGRATDAGSLATALAATLRTSMARSVQRSEQRSGVYRPARRITADHMSGGVHAA